MRRQLAAGPAIVLAALVVGWGAAAQAPQTPAPGAAPSPEQAAPAPAANPPAAPNQGVGLIDSFGRWMQESTAGFNANLNAAWEKMPGKGMTGAASNAAKSTAEVAKGAAEVTQDAASAMGAAARDTAGALSRLPGARIVAGRERCGVAPNGAPDCRVAAVALCKAAGLPGGASIDFETAEVCASAELMARWRGEAATCPTENYVTRSLCQ